MKNFFELKGEGDIEYLQFSCMWCQKQEAKMRGFCSKECEEAYFEEINKWLLKESNP